MKTIKFILVFALGVVAGGLIFGFQGPAPSQAEGALPSDLFYLARNFSNKQYYCINTSKYPNYQVTEAGKTSSGSCIYAYISKK
jgi:hypothetical protein